MGYRRLRPWQVGDPVKHWMPFRDAILLANKVGIKEERLAYDENEIVLDLLDGSSLHFESNYDEGWSEVTPGEGIQPPSVYLIKKEA